jgi:hypothetical protein
LGDRVSEFGAHVAGAGQMVKIFNGRLTRGLAGRDATAKRQAGLMRGLERMQSCFIRAHPTDEKPKWA